MDKQITMKIPEEMYQDLKEISTKKGNKLLLFYIKIKFLIP